MTSLFGIIPVPVLDQKQTEMMVVGVTAAMLYANWNWVMNLPNLYINTIVSQRR